MYHSFVYTLEQLELLCPRYFKMLGLFLSAIGGGILLLIIPPEPEFTHRVYELGLEMSLFLVLVFWGLFSRRGSFGEWVSFAATLSLFVLSLIYKWQVLDNNFLIGGFLPWSDNYGYYDEAQRLLHGFSLTVWGAHRPIFPAFLSVGLAITNNNFQMVLVILVLLNGFAAYLAAREIQVSLKSAIGAAVYLVISFLFYRRFAGTFMTENFGFLTGNLALVFILQGTREDEIKKLYWGLFILTLGLNARAGAFFVLPTISIWITYCLRQKFIWWRVFAGAMIVVFLGMGLNLILLKLIGPSEGGVPFSNYSYTFYSLASGGAKWDQVFKDYPGIKEEDVPALAVQKFKEKPYVLVTGIIGSYQDFFTSYRGAFSFTLFKKGQKVLANLVLWVLTAISLAFAIFGWKKNKYLSMALAGFLGIFLSIALLPPHDADLMRVYATTIPITAYIASLGISIPGALWRNYIKPSNLEPLSPILVSNFAFPVSITLLIMLFFGVLLVKQYGHLLEKRNVSVCLPGNENIGFLLSPGSSIALEPDEVIKESYVPYLRISDFMRQAGKYDPEISNTLLALHPGEVLNLGTSVDNVAGRENIQSAFFVSPHILEPGYYELCITASNSQLLQIYPLYFITAETISDAQPVLHLPDINTINMIRFYYLVGGWILFGLMMLDIVQIWKYPLKIVPLIFGNTVVMGVGILVLLHSLGLAPMQWESIPLKLERAKNTVGFLYVVDLGNTWMSKTGIWNYPVRLYENDVELGGAEQRRASVIASDGAGNFTVVDGYLYFSSSDNSDPQKNGRQYQIVWPTPIRLRYQWISFILASLSLFIHVRYLKRLL